MPSAQLVKLALNFTRRDWRAGELRLLAMALVLAVAAVTSVGFLVDRLRAGLLHDAARLLGADAVVVSDSPIPDTVALIATRAGLRTAQVVTFPSMAVSARNPDLTALVAVKAVSEGYPLRGELRVKTQTEGPDEVAAHGPARGSVWVDRAVLSLLQLNVGDTMQLGDLQLRIDRLITLEPDRSMSFINLAPRAMLHVDDLAATHLVQPASRVVYRLMVAGAADEVRKFKAQSQLSRGQRLESVETGRPEIQSTLERAQRFLSLVAMLAALVAAVAIAAVARRFTLRHLDACALLRCFGLAQREIFMLFALEFLGVACLASAAGVVAGFGLHFVLMSFLAGWTPSALPAASGLPALQGFTLGIVLLLGFALPPLAQLRNVSPLRVLRKEFGLPKTRVAWGYGLGLVGFAGLLLWAAGDLRLGLMTVAGFGLGLAAFAGAGWLLLQLLRPLSLISTQQGMSWRFALAALRRRRAATVVQLVTLAVGLMALLLLTLVRTDLVRAWRTATPEDAPNQYIINIQPEQRSAVAQRLAQAGVGAIELHPMVRGRLVAINDRDVTPEQFNGERAQRLVEREFNLSYASQAPPHNVLVFGKWFAPDAAELSIEEGIANTLGVRLGDELSFLIAGQSVRARVTSVRKVNWDSMRANFFVIMAPVLLEGQPQTFMTAFHLPTAAQTLPAQLLREFPNLTFIDTQVVFAQVQAVLGQVVAMVEFLFLFTLLAGVLVLYVALVATHDERVREIALLRALGASRVQVAQRQYVPLLSLGLLSGLLAALGASAAGWGLAHFVFDFSYTASAWIYFVGTFGGGLCAVAVGYLGLRPILNTPPLATLREA